jgi:hypothetical protein
MEHSDAWAMQAAHGQDSDWSLERLLRLIDGTGMPFPITLLVDGVFIKGAAVQVEDWADHLDAAMDNILKGAAAALAAEQRGLSVDDLSSAGATAGDIEKWRADWSSRGWRSLVDERRDSHAELTNRLEEATGGQQSPLSSLPEDLAERAVERELPIRALTVKDASLFSFGLGGGPLEVPYVRVDVRHVAAWWPGGFDWSAVATEPE